MKKNFTVISLALACLLGFAPSVAKAGDVYENTPVTVKWALGGQGDESASVNDEARTAIQQSGVTFGGNLKVETATYFDTQMTKLTPSASNMGVVEGVMVEYRIKPCAGLKFTPESVSFDAVKVGTDGATVSYSFVCDGEEGAAVNVPAAQLLRNNNANASSASLNHAIEVSLGECSEFAFRYYISSTANNKNQCIANVTINGKLNGEILQVNQYTVSATANIAEAGTVKLNPDAPTYDEGSAVKVSASKNFGYRFINWTDAGGDVVSAEPDFTYTVKANAELTANFEKINTYELYYTLSGGANSYQVQPSPAPVMVDGKMMYEDGTVVTLTATSNRIMTFTNWNDGQSSSEITVKMDADHIDIVANFDAVDFVAGWDFYNQGGDGRVADFASADNDAAALVMRNAAGETSGWLDKSAVAADGYEGRPAAVNWRTTGLGEYYWQTMVNAEAFTDLKVVTSMLYNYNAYTTYNIEYSLDGEQWNLLGTVEIEGRKNWTDAEVNLPADANNHPTVYVRFIADKTSSIDGTDSNNDGIALGPTYVLGTARLIDDGTAPLLIGQVPEEGSNTASINGKVVLTFDEKVKVKDGAVATLAGERLTPSVTGKTVMFEYNNLAYSTDYRFALPAGSIMDLTDNAVADEIVINFTTKTRPEVDKALYDAEVKTVDELMAAIAKAENRADNTKRFRIFIYNGTYQLPASATATKTGSDGKDYPDPTTSLNSPNVSFVGESRDGVVITNTVPQLGGSANVLEGIGNGDVLRLNKGAYNTYFQDLTIKSAMGDKMGRDIEVNDNSDKTIWKNVCLWGYQDTYVSNNEQGRFYFEGGLLRGRTDYLCGKGDVYYNGVTLQMCETGGYITAPSVKRAYGYVFKDCEIVGENSGIDGNFTLGRPWGSGTPMCLWIDTKMTAKPSAAGWNEMSGGYPARFAEYNSTTASGTVIDLKNRKKTFGDGHDNNPVLTKEEADFYSYARVMGGDDNWDPALLAEQAPAPANVRIDDNTLYWDNNNYALCWAVCKNGRVVAFTTEPFYVIADADIEASTYAVRAANEMGGLGEAVEAGVQSSISEIEAAGAEVVSTVYYNLQGVKVSPDATGVLIKVETLATGKTVITKVINTL